MRKSKSYFIYKNQFLTGTLAVLFAPVLLQAQINGKVDGQPERFVKSKHDTTRTGDDIFNVVKVGIIMPQGQFAQAITNPGGNMYDFNNLSKPFKGLDGLGAKPGYDIQYEGFSFLWRIKSDKKPIARVGLQYGFDFGYVPINWNNVQWGNYNMLVGTNPFIFMGFKLGPAFYFNPTKDMGIGIYALADGFLSAPGGENASYNATDGSGTNTVEIYDIKDSNNVHFNVDFSAGINVYYKAIIIGVEDSWLHTQYYGAIQETSTLTQSNGTVTSPTYNYSFSNVLHLNVIKVTLGVRLGYGRRSSRDKFE